MAIEKRETKSERTRNRILQSAARIFREVGYASASLRDIAEEAEMQAGSLYYHFDNKEKLAEAVMSAGVNGARDAAKSAVEALGPDANPFDKIEAAFSAHLAYMLAESDFAVASLRMLHQTPDGVRRRTLRRQREYGRFIGSLFEEAQSAGFIRREFDLSSLRMLMMGAMNWAPEWYDESGLSPEDLIHQLCQLVAKGVLPENVSLAAKRSARPQAQTS